MRGTCSPSSGSSMTASAPAAAGRQPTPPWRASPSVVSHRVAQLPRQRVRRNLRVEPLRARVLEAATNTPAYETEIRSA